MSGPPMTFVGASNVAPASNSVQADTGILAAGNYELVINLMASDTIAVGKGLIAEHRNAANSATVAVIGAVAGAANSRYVSSIGSRFA